jgi:hypothetical protein
MGRPTQEGRRNVRRQTSYPVEFALTDGTRRSGVCRDISLGGAHIEAAEPAPFGASVIIFMQLRGIEGTTALPGIVRWTKRGSMGVQLGLFGARVTHAIIRMLADADG